MIVVDTSAVIAILRKEPGFEQFVAAIDADDALIMSNANYLELAIVLLRRYGREGLIGLDRLPQALPLELRDVDREQLRFAIEAYARFGRGSGQPACLNFGDCFAYALAKATGAPLLYKGDDFAQTDVRSAL